MLAISGVEMMLVRMRVSSWPVSLATFADVVSRGQVKIKVPIEASRPDYCSSVMSGYV
jgi:hypothetical protein